MRVTARISAVPFWNNLDSLDSQNGTVTPPLSIFLDSLFFSPYRVNESFSLSIHTAPLAARNLGKWNYAVRSAPLRGSEVAAPQIAPAMPCCLTSLRAYSLA